MARAIENIAMRRPVRLDRARTLLRRFALLGCVAGQSCADDRVAYVSLDFRNGGWTSDVAISVGDTGQVVSVATTYRGGLLNPGRVLFDSRTDPAAFRWVIADTTIASVSATGVVTGRGTGRTE